MKKLRFLPFAILGLNVFGGLIALGVQGPTSGVSAFLAFNAFLIGLATTVFLVQSRRAKKAVARGETVVREAAQSAFDAPAEIVPKFESSLHGIAGTLGPGGSMSPAEGFTAIGKVDGVPTMIATGTSMLARQAFELHHTYSYVCVNAENAAGTFRFIGRDSYSKWASIVGDLPDHKSGDDAFDAQWVISGDPDIARDVIDASLKSKLTALQKRAHSVSDLGMSIELTGMGLVVRWPNELDPVLAIELRDLALTLRKRLLEYLRRESLIDAAAEQNVRVDIGEETETEAPDEESAKERSLTS